MREGEFTSEDITSEAVRARKAEQKQDPGATDQEQRAATPHEAGARARRPSPAPEPGARARRPEPIDDLYHKNDMAKPLYMTKYFYKYSAAAGQLPPAATCPA